MVNICILQEKGGNTPQALDEPMPAAFKTVAGKEFAPFLTKTKMLRLAAATPTTTIHDYNFPKDNKRI